MIKQVTSYSRKRRYTVWPRQIPRPAQAGRHFPIDALDIIAWRIFADLFKLDAGPTENRLILPGHQRIYQARAFEVHLLDFLYDFR